MRGGASRSDALPTISDRTLAERIIARRGFDELGLPASVLNSLRALGEQVKGARAVDDRWTSRTRRSHVALLTGLAEGSDGKDLRRAAAEALASYLGRALLRIDSCGVAACWDERVEQLLEEALYAAEVEGAVLFFDRAEHLFGRDRDVVDTDGRSVDVIATGPLERLFDDFGGLTLFATESPEQFGPDVARSLDLIVELVGGR